LAKLSGAVIKALRFESSRASGAAQVFQSGVQVLDEEAVQRWARFHGPTG